MSELLDKQLWQPMNKRVTAKGEVTRRKCAMKIKKKKNDCMSKKIYDKKDFIRLRNHEDVKDRLDRKD